MPRHTNLMSLFEDIATQIRAKKGESSSVTYKVDDLDTAVSTITTYKPEETFSVTPTTSKQTITPSSGHVFSGGTVAAMPIGSLSAGSATISLTGQNVTFSDTYNGIPLYASGRGTVSVGTAGYLAAGTSQQSNAGQQTKFLVGVTVPTDTDFVVDNNGYLGITNEPNGYVSLMQADETYPQSIMENGNWITTTVNPSSSIQGPYYGKVFVNPGGYYYHEEEFSGEYDEVNLNCNFMPKGCFCFFTPSSASKGSRGYTVEESSSNTICSFGIDFYSDQCFTTYLKYSGSFKVGGSWSDSTGYVPGCPMVSGYGNWGVSFIGQAGYKWNINGTYHFVVF